MKRLLLWTMVLLMLPLWALAVTTVPASVTEVGDEAFADTGIDALIVPASVNHVGAGVLRGTEAAYILLQGEATTLADDGGAAFVFGPAASPARELANFYDAARLVVSGGVYYFVTDTALPLCLQEPGSTSGSITIPKLVEGVPVVSAEKLYVKGSGVTEVRVPAYLGQAAGMTTAPYATMSLAAPQADVTTAPAGQRVTWTTAAEGAYGTVTYTWVFDVAGQTSIVTTAEPSVTFAPMAEGVCTVTVTAVDALGDQASAAGGEITVTAMNRRWRALLVGNSYPGESIKLDGPLTDLTAMRTMLGSMSGTPYEIKAMQNITASGMQAAIASAFAGAEPGDVSLFYFSGHGTSDGALVGTGGTTLSVYGLRSALQNIPGTKIVLLDCCYSGTSIGRGVSMPSAFNRAIINALSNTSRSAVNLEDQGYIVLTSCRQDQTSVSLTGGDNHHWGAFTYALCYGSGYDEWNQTSLGRLPADRNGDGAITLSEAHAGVQERINFLATLVEIDQATQYYGDTAFVLWAK